MEIRSIEKELYNTKEILTTWTESPNTVNKLTMLKDMCQTNDVLISRRFN